MYGCCDLLFVALAFLGASGPFVQVAPSLSCSLTWRVAGHDRFALSLSSFIDLWRPGLAWPESAHCSGRRICGLVCLALVFCILRHSTLREGAHGLAFTLICQSHLPSLFLPHSYPFILLHDTMTKQNNPSPHRAWSPKVSWHRGLQSGVDLISSFLFRGVRVG